MSFLAVKLVLGRCGKKALIILAAVVLVGLAAAAVLRRGPSEWRLAFEDEFSRDILGPAWRLHGGVWEVRGGRLTSPWRGESTVVCRRRLSGDVRVEFRAALAEGAPETVRDLRILFLHSESAGPGGPGYVLRLGDLGGACSAIERNLREVSLSGEGRLAGPGQTRRVVAEIAGGLVSLSVDGEAVASYVELFGVDCEAVGLGQYGGGVTIDDLKLYTRRAARGSGAEGRGDRLFAKGEYAAAAEEYADGSATEGPAGRRCQVKEGVALVRAGDESGRVRLESFRGSELWAAAATWLVDARVDGGDLDGALALLRELRAGGGAAGAVVPPAAVRHGARLRRLGMPARALDFLEIASLPGGGVSGGAEAHRERAKAYRELGRPGQALAELALAVRQHAGGGWQGAEARVLVGVVLLEQGKFDEAIAAFDAVRTDRTASRWLRGRATMGSVRCLERVGKKDDAHALAEKYAADEASERYWRAEALIMLMRGRPEGLERVRTELPDQAWQCARSMLIQARLTRRSGDSGAAFRLFERAAEEYGDQRGLALEARIEAARTLRDRLGGQERAAAMLDEVASMKAVPAEAVAARARASVELAITHMIAGKADEARRVLEDKGPGTSAGERFWRATADFLLHKIPESEFRRRASYPIDWKAYAAFYAAESKRRGVAPTDRREPGPFMAPEMEPGAAKPDGE